MSKRENDDLIVEVSDDQLALKLENDETPEIVAEPENNKPEKKTEVVVDKGNDDAVETLRAQIARLERERDENARQVAEERRQRLEAQQEAQQRAKDAEDASGRAHNNELGMVGGYIAAAKSKQVEIRSLIRAAVEAGDLDRAEDLRMEAARVASRLVQYEDHKQDLEARAERAKAEPRVEPVRKSADPVDAIEGVSDTSKAWLRKHPECVTNPGKNAKLLYGHHEAIEKGIRPDTPEYFEHLELHMGFKQAQVEDDGEEETAPAAKVERRSMPSAPVSRDNRAGAVAPGKYRISREEADMAESLNMTPTEYVTWKLKAEKAGRYASQH